MRPAVAAVLLLALLAVPAPAQPMPEPQVPPTVTAIELRIEGSRGRERDLEPLIAFRPGEVLTEAAVRRTLSNLQATGLYSTIELLTRPADERDGDAGDGDAGVVAVVVLRSRVWVRAVELEGRPGLAPAVILRAIAQKEKSPLERDAIEASVETLRRLYVERGFREAEIDARIEPLGDRRVDVVFALESGPRAVVGEIELAGENPYGAELRQVLRSRPGTLYDPERARADARRLRAFLVRRGHLAAAVGEPELAYDGDARRMDLRFPLDPGPVYEVEVEGFERRPLARRGLLDPLYDEPFDEAVAERVAGRIDTWLERRGHYRARVGYRLETPEPDRRRLVFEVAPGEVYELRAVRFAGNERIDSDALRPLVSTTPRKRLRPGSGKLVREDLEADLANLRSYYLLQGFGEVEVGPPQVLEIGDEIELVIPIREGRRQRVVDLALVGVEHFAPGELLLELPLEPGGPYHPALLDDSVNLLRSRYENAGFLTAEITPSLDWNPERTLVDVALAVREGPRAHVDRLLLRGHRHTRPEILRRFIRLERGDPVSRRKLLEVERDLYRLGIFSQVDVEQVPAVEEPGSRDVVVRLEEGRQWRLAYGFSYHSDDGLGGLLSVARVNVGGRGDRVQLDLRGNEADRRFRLIYDQPFLWRLDLPVTYNLYRQQEDRQSFTVNETGAQVLVTKTLRGLRLRGVVGYRRVDLSAESIDPIDVERENREVEILSTTGTLLVDRRDDLLDPTRGWSTTVQLEHAFPALSADADFLKLFAQQTRYWPLGIAGTLAASLRLGAIEPFDPDARPDPLVPPDLPSALVPVSERFFAGGRTTHRAYERDRLGILGQTLFRRDDGRVIEPGGNGLVLLNLDYRFPIRDPVGGTVFLDYGNVWADWRDVDPGDMKPGIGLGVRYASPIGPVRLEVGWKLDPEPGDDTDPVFFFSFGNPF